MLRWPKHISLSNEWRRLEDGQYLYRDHPWSRTVILDGKTAFRVFEARERLLRKVISLVFCGMGLAGVIVVGFWNPTAELYSGVLGGLIPLLLVIVFVSILINAYWYFARERAYYRIVRRAPTASEKLHFQWKRHWAQVAERLTPAGVKFSMIFCSIFAVLLAFGAAVALMDQATNWPLFSLCAFLCIVCAFTTVLDWKILRIQKDNHSTRSPSKQ